MFNELKELLHNSNSEYYHYNVAAIIVCKNGEKFNGVNIETSSPAAGVCAERNAIFSAISNGYKKDDFKELHIMVNADDSSEPCFICRQALVDFTDQNMPIYMYSKDKLEKTLTVKNLTPYPFNKEDLI